MALCVACVIVAVFGRGAAAQQSPQDFRSICPTNSAQQLLFESKKILVDSALRNLGKGREEVINCIHILDAKHEYYVDLVGTNLQNVWTQNGGYLAVNDPFVTRAAEYQPTLLYVGPNRARYDVKILREKSKIGALFDDVVTWLVASLPTQRAEPEKNLRPVVLEFHAYRSASTVKLEFRDRAPGSAEPIAFRFSDMVGNRIPTLRGQTLLIGRETASLGYELPKGESIVLPAQIYFLNADKSPVASMDVFLFF
jgi:hypothetical protein